MANKNELTPQAAEELLKYKKLLDNGLISQDEYEAKKSQVLGTDKKAEEENHKNSIYISACKQIESSDTDTIRQGISKLQAIIDWKDAKDKIAEGEAKIKKLSEYDEQTLLQAQSNLILKEQQKILKKDKRKKWFKTIKKFG